MISLYYNLKKILKAVLIESIETNDMFSFLCLINVLLILIFLAFGEYYFLSIINQFWLIP